MAAFSPAHAATRQENPTASDAAPSQPNCGQSVDDALKAARAALKVNDVAHDHAALICLVAALNSLNAARLDAVRDVDHAHVLAVPKNGADAP